MIAPMYTHRMPEYFADPERFDPERFLPPREEDRAHPYALVEFGGGTHACLGSGIAKLVMKAMVTKLLRRYELTLVAGQDFTPVFIPAGRPEEARASTTEKRRRVQPSYNGTWNACAQ